MTENKTLPQLFEELAARDKHLEELYTHRNTLFLALIRHVPEIAWMSQWHYDGSQERGWFIAGLHTSAGDISYHLPMSMWNLAVDAGASVIPRGKPWDGHTDADTVFRLQAWIIDLESADRD